MTDGTVGLYLGWVTIATAANIAAVLAASGWDGWGIPPETWGVLVVALAGLVGIALAVWDHGRIAPTLSLGWGLAWIAVARLTDAPASTVVGITAIIAVVAIVLVTVAVRVAGVLAAPSRRGVAVALSASRLPVLRLTHDGCASPKGMSSHVRNGPHNRTTAQRRVVAQPHGVKSR